ncbi:MAG: DUF2306 domain-containing protein [Caldilineaceae bacterium]
MARDLLNEMPPPVTRPESIAVSAAVLHWASIALVATVWLSATLFGLYILAFYAGALAAGEMAEWNNVLPRLYEAETPVATAGIGLHFAAGGIILVLGCIQLIGAVRLRYPALHRWLGRLYVSAALLAGIGGLTFIAAKGTVGGTVMDIGFSLYGLLMVLAAVQTYRYAQARQRDRHRAWALRLFALAIGSWLYRMDYGFWLLLTDGAGHTRDFRGPFDMVMAFFFYVPNLLVVEALLRARRQQASPTVQLVTAGLLAGATGFLLLGTYYFPKLLGGPAILERLM